MSDIIISYALADQERAQTIVSALRQAGLAVWWDRDIETGADRRATIAEKIAGAKLVLVLWSNASITAVDVIDEAEAARGRGTYLGMRLDDVSPPFGFGGYTPVDVAPFTGAADQLAAIVAAAKEQSERGASGPEALGALKERQVKGRSPVALIIVAVLALAVAGGVGWFAFRQAAPSPRELVEAKLTGIPCAWLNVDPVRDGADGTMGLIGVAGDPAQAGAAVTALVQAEKLPVERIIVDKVATIDPRECPAIDEPIRLRKSPGGRLRVSGEPFILDTSLPKAQALTRVQISLKEGDKTMALFGVEPSGIVTWALPDIASLDALKGMDVGYQHPGDREWEFSIYPDHVGWTGLFVVVGDRPLGKVMPQGATQSSREFAATLREATREGEWDTDMVWFRIDPK
jgi:hypothetical protein